MRLEVMMSAFKRCPFCKLNQASESEKCPKCGHLFLATFTNLRGVGAGAPYGEMRACNDVVRVLAMPMVALFSYLHARTVEAEDYLGKRVKKW